MTFTTWHSSTSAQSSRPRGTLTRRLVGALAVTLVAVTLPQLAANAGVLTPTATITKPDARVTPAGKFRVEWTVTPGSADVANSDVRVRSARYDGAFSGWTLWQDATTATSGTYDPNMVGVICFSARGRDVNGQVGAWSPQKCTIEPVDGANMSRAQEFWDVHSCSKCYGATYTASIHHGEWMFLDNVTTKRLAFVVDTCPTCGTFYVMLGMKGMGKVDLTSPTAERKVIKTLQTWRRPHTGRLWLKVISPDQHTVAIDAVAVGRL